MFQSRVRCIWRGAFKLDTQLTWCTYRTTEFLQTELLWEDELCRKVGTAGVLVESTILVFLGTYFSACLLKLWARRIKHSAMISNNGTSVDRKQYSNELLKRITEKE